MADMTPFEKIKILIENKKQANEYLKNALKNKRDGFEIQGTEAEIVRNLTTFLNNCSIKVRDNYDEFENDVSKYMFDFFEKFYINALDEKDKIDMIDFVFNFNEIILKKMFSDPLLLLGLEMFIDNGNIDVKVIKKSNLDKFIQNYKNTLKKIMNNVSNVLIKENVNATHTGEEQLFFVNFNLNKTSKENNLDNLGSIIILFETFYYNAKTHLLKLLKETDYIIERLLIKKIIEISKTDYFEKIIKDYIKLHNLKYEDIELNFERIAIDVNQIKWFDNFTFTSPFKKFSNSEEIKIEINSNGINAIDDISKLLKLFINLESIEYEVDFDGKTLKRSPKVYFNFNKNVAIEYANIFSLNKTNSIIYSEKVIEQNEANNIQHLGDIPTTPIIFYTNPQAIKHIRNYLTNNIKNNVFNNIIHYRYLFTINENLPNKSRADFDEQAQITNYNPFITSSFNIKINDDNKKEIEEIFNMKLDNSHEGIRFVLLYKEFNKKYQQLMFSEIIESLMYNVLNLSNGIDSLFLAKNNSYINKNFVFSLRNFDTTKIKNYFDEDIDVFIACKHFFGNPYSVRQKDFSSIVGYFLGNGTTKGTFLTDYGKSKEDLNQISLFLEYYEQCLDYYNKTLLLDSLIEEKNYSTYEFLFVAVMALDLYFNKQIENITDISEYGYEELEKFFDSYGFHELNKISNFNENLDWKRKLAVNYNKLVKNKGSQKVIELLLKMFSSNASLLNVNKYFLIEDTRKSFDDSLKYNKDNSALKFVKIPFLTEYPISAIKEAVLSNNVFEYESFIADDPYWSKSMSEKVIINNTNLSFIETKYINMVITLNEKFEAIKRNYILSFFDFIYERFKTYAEGKLKTYETLETREEPEYVIKNVDIKSLVDMIKFMLRTIYIFKDVFNITNQEQKKTKILEELDNSITKSNGSFGFYGFNKHDNKDDLEQCFKNVLKIENFPFVQGKTTEVSGNVIGNFKTLSFGELEPNFEHNTSSNDNILISNVKNNLTNEGKKLSNTCLNATFTFLNKYNNPEYSASDDLLEIFEKLNPVYSLNFSKNNSTTTINKLQPYSHKLFFNIFLKNYFNKNGLSYTDSIDPSLGEVYNEQILKETINMEEAFRLLFLPSMEFVDDFLDDAFVSKKSEKYEDLYFTQDFYKIINTLFKEMFVVETNPLYVEFYESELKNDTVTVSKFNKFMEKYIEDLLLVLNKDYEVYEKKKEVLGFYNTYMKALINLIEQFNNTFNIPEIKLYLSNPKEIEQKSKFLISVLNYFLSHNQTLKDINVNKSIYDNKDSVMLAESVYFEGLVDLYDECFIEDTLEVEDI